MEQYITILKGKKCTRRIFDFSYFSIPDGNGKKSSGSQKFSKYTLLIFIWEKNCAIIYVLLCLIPAKQVKTQNKKSKNV